MLGSVAVAVAWAPLCPAKVQLCVIGTPPKPVWPGGFILGEKLMGVLVQAVVPGNGKMVGACVGGSFTVTVIVELSGGQPAELAVRVTVWVPMAVQLILVTVLVGALITPPPVALQV